MTKSILDAILIGNLLPWEEKSINTPEFKRLNEKICQEREHFEKYIPPSEKERFDRYNCLLMERESKETASALSDVFLIGLLLGMEVVERREVFLRSTWNND